MPGTVYALLVGINDYQGALKSLKGCVEDVTQLAAILEARLAPGQFKPNFLLDRDATRDNVIAAFAAHLGQAKDGDVALFAYSGHGSRERVQPEFRYLEPDGWNQTLVLADSRLPDSTDLADKELRALLNRVAGGADDPHVVVILDCCYSGGGTREPMVGEVSLRQAPAVKDARPLESYLAEVQNAVRSDADSGGDHEHPTGPVASLPHPKHIALEACERHQTAKEILVDGKHRGAFSLALQHALTSLPNGATYRDLLRTAQNQVVNLVSGQTPLATDEGESLDQPFLGGAIQPRPATITLEFQHGSWWIDAGVMHGLQPTRGDRTTRLAVRELANPEGEALGHVRVVEAGTTRSRVALDGLALTEDCLYAAVVVGVPEPLLGVEGARRRANR